MRASGRGSREQTGQAADPARAFTRRPHPSHPQSRKQRTMVAKHVGHGVWTLGGIHHGLLVRSKGG